MFYQKNQFKVLTVIKVKNKLHREYFCYATGKTGRILTES